MKKNIVQIIAAGGVGVLLTDTLYGVVAGAFDPEAVLWVYHAKKRNAKKPVIVLISDIADLALFGIRPTKPQQEILAQIWPGPVSVALSCKAKKFAYLHRGKNSLAFRVPAKKSLRVLLKKAGPLVAPSANPEGKPPAKNIAEAKKYFGSLLDFYVGEGTVRGQKPSALISLAKDGTIKTLR